MISVAVVCESSSRAGRAKDIAATLDVPFFLGVPLGNFNFVLAVTDDAVELRWGTGGVNEEMNPLVIDFSGGAVNHRLRSKSQSRDLLLKAVGSQSKKVLDLTGGFGTDAFILAGNGCQVTSFERSPILAILVNDALERGRRDPQIAKACERLEFKTGESLEFLKRVSDNKRGSEQWDAIYLDPMFPEKKKSSLPKKELQFLQELVGIGNEDESRTLLAEAGKHSRRIVVKRPVNAPPLHPGTSATIKGRSVRFDIYIFN